MRDFSIWKYVFFAALQKLNYVKEKNICLFIKLIDKG